MFYKVRYDTVSVCLLVKDGVGKRVRFVLSLSATSFFWQMMTWRSLYLFISILPFEFAPISRTNIYLRVRFTARGCLPSCLTVNAMSKLSSSIPGRMEKNTIRTWIVRVVSVARLGDRWRLRIRTDSVQVRSCDYRSRFDLISHQAVFYRRGHDHRTLPNRPYRSADSTCVRPFGKKRENIYIRLSQECVITRYRFRLLENKRLSPTDILAGRRTSF